MYHYFVSFSHVTNGNSGFGNTDLTLDRKITGIDILKEITKNIEKNFFLNNVVILNFRIYEDSDNKQKGGIEMKFTKIERINIANQTQNMYSVKVKERSTGRVLELNPNIDNSFSDTMTRRLFHSGEYILISGDLPDKWK